MVNYANSKVYKIWSTQGDKIYVGSTTKQYLSQRMDAHRSKYKSYKDTKYHFISSFELFDLYGLDNCFIELLESKECSSKDELIKIEGKYLRDLECVNKRIEGRTKKEYYESNKIKVLERQNKKYNCECGHIYSQSNKSNHLKTIKHCKFIESKTIKPEVDEV